MREAKERGYAGGYSVLRDCVRDLRPPRTAGFAVRFETPPGEQAQVDFAHFEVEFADDPGVKRIVWLFSMVLGLLLPYLGPLRHSPGPAERPALSYRRSRGDRRRAARDSL
jgi:hypothetical protein